MHDQMAMYEYRQAQWSISAYVKDPRKRKHTRSRSYYILNIGLQKFWPALKAGFDGSLIAAMHAIKRVERSSPSAAQIRVLSKSTNLFAKRKSHALGPMANKR